MTRENHIELLEKALAFATRKGNKEKAYELRGMILRLLKERREEVKRGKV